MIAKLMKPLLAVVFTAAVFLVMRILIIPSEEGPTVSETPPLIDITRPPRDENSKTKERVKPVKPEPKKLPPLQKIIPNNLAAIDKNALGGVHIPTDFGKPGNSGTIISDRHATPLVRIPPQYPIRLVESGVEGWVVVEFTINLAGAVEDVRIVDAEPANVFDRAVVKAIQRWKYQPKLVNGQPVAQYNMRELVTFKIEQ